MELDEKTRARIVNDTHARESQGAHFAEGDNRSGACSLFVVVPCPLPRSRSSLPCHRSRLWRSPTWRATPPPPLSAVIVTPCLSNVSQPANIRGIKPGEINRVYTDVIAIVRGIPAREEEEEDLIDVGILFCLFWGKNYSDWMKIRWSE